MPLRKTRCAYCESIVDLLDLEWMQGCLIGPDRERLYLRWLCFECVRHYDAIRDAIFVISESKRTEEF